ncbi:DUF5819 family protein [Oligoflexus tunisiensis]|uniref:DUF5819 family protein n=1 Tax=Oligoflexus tunisiensis TaxID=708132 RepID=UPI00114C9E62|nr:DUF5819 family protein [Oligoflexus tunisiensis]
MTTIYQRITEGIAIAGKASSAGAILALWILIFMWNTPANPLKIEMQGILNRTIGAYLNQNWSLFAPNPINNNIVLLIKPLTKAEMDRFLFSDQQFKDGWFDVSSSLWKAMQANRLSAYDRLSRVISGTARSLVSMPSGMQYFDKLAKNGDEDVKQYIESVNEVHRMARQQMIARIGSSILMDMFPLNPEYSHFAVMIRMHKKVPWSKRYEHEAMEPETVFGGLYVFNRSVASPKIFNEFSND